MPNDRKGSLFEVLEWDSKFFGFPIVRLQPESVSEANWGSVVDAGRKFRFQAAYLLVPAADPATLRRAQELGFRLVDIRVTLLLPLLKTACEVEGSICSAVREAEAGDLPALKSIAGCSHRNTRFYLDGRFPIGLCDRLYETWVERSYRRENEAVFVALADGAPVGYITCRHRGEDGQIGLLAVAEAFRGEGLGGSLVETVQKWLFPKGVRRVYVVTQGNSQGALLFYQRQGFEVVSMDLWFHYWFREP